MKKRSLCLAMIGALAFALVPGVMAQDESVGDIARVSYWKAKDGMKAELEDGIKKHNELHANKGDTHAIYTWEIVTGKHAGTYARGSFELAWSDLDRSEDYLKADTADAAATIDPYIESDVPVIYRFLPKWSLVPADKEPAALARVVHYHLKNGMRWKFRDVIHKIHTAVKRSGEEMYYLWYEVIDGGDIPTYVVSVPADSWADFAPTDNPVSEILVVEYGEEEAKELYAAFDSVDEQHSATFAYRPDLSYLPEMSAGN